MSIDLWSCVLLRVYSFLAFCRSPYTITCLHKLCVLLLLRLLVVTERLPYSIRVLLESGVRNYDGFQITTQDVGNLLDWSENQDKKIEIPFRPARVILQDFTCVYTQCSHDSIYNTLRVHTCSVCVWDRCNGRRYLLCIHGGVYSTRVL